jgi:flagellar motor switch protein FliM
MKVGDVIPLNQDASGEIDVTIESTVKYRGLYGASRGQRAIQITQVVENKNLEFIKETKDDILRKKLRKRED